MLSNISKFLLFILFIVTSCKDHDITIEKPCKFLGITSHSIQKSYNQVTNYYYDSELLNNDSDLPSQYTVIIKSSTIDTTDQSLISNISEEHLYFYEYNSDGFLTKITHTTTTLNQGSNRSTFIYDNYPSYKQGRIEVKEITNYQYQTGLLSTRNTQVSIIFSSENTTTKTQKIQITKTYTYDLDNNGTVLKMTESFADGGKQIYNYIGANLSSKTFIDNNGAISSSSLYNEKGKIKSLKSGSNETRYFYDNKENSSKIEFYYNNSLNLLFEYSYDDNPNPELLNSKVFKGILDPFQILITTEGVNNLIRRKTTNSQANMSYENKLNYKYNSKGYPETSLSISDSNTNVSTLTTYKYQDCQ